MQHRYRTVYQYPPPHQKLRPYGGYIVSRRASKPRSMVGLLLLATPVNLCACMCVYVYQQGLLSLTSQRTVCKTWKAHPSYWGVGAFRSKFYGNGAIPCQSVDTVPQVVDCAIICRWKFLDNETLYQSFDGCWSKFTVHSAFMHVSGIGHELAYNRSVLIGGALLSPSAARCYTA